MKTFGEQRMETRGQPIEFDGRVVHGIWTISLTVDEGLSVRFVSSSSEVAQGLRMKLSARKGLLVIEGQEIREAVLWVETAPPRPIVIFPKSRQLPQVLSIWNVWKGISSCDAWIGNSGMVVEASEPTLRLRCSDGVGPPNFEDLVVELTRVSSTGP